MASTVTTTSDPDLMVPEDLGVVRTVGEFGSFGVGAGTVGQPLGTRVLAYGRPKDELVQLSSSEWMGLCAVYLRRLQLEVLHYLNSRPDSVQRRRSFCQLAGLCEELAFCAQASELDPTPLTSLRTALHREMSISSRRLIDQVSESIPPAALLVDRLESKLVADTKAKCPSERWSDLDKDGQRAIIIREASRARVWSVSLLPRHLNVSALSRHVAENHGSTKSAVRSSIYRWSGLLDEVNDEFTTARRIEALA